MANPNFASLLDVDMDDVKPPATFPKGTWHWIVQGQPRNDKSTKKGTEYYEYTLKPIAPRDDVEEEDLKEFGDYSDKTMKATFYVTEKSLFMLKDFLAACGLQGKMSEAIFEATNCEVLGYIRHEASEDGKRIFAKFGGFAPVE